MIAGIVALAALFQGALSCSNFVMNFTEPNIRLSARTMDLGLEANWTITSWPVQSSFPLPPHEYKRTLSGGSRNSKFYEYVYDSSLHKKWVSKYGILGVTANWFGDDKWGFPSLFADSMNDQGLSCALMTLVDTDYGEAKIKGENVFAGVFCLYMTQNFATVQESYAAMENINIWGPDAIAQHFVIHDANGDTLVVEAVDGRQKLYLETKDAKDNGAEEVRVGVVTNEPALDWHYVNVQHYEWKRTLARQSIAIPGNFYPEERFMRAYMVKKGMDDLMASTKDYKMAFSLTTQILNTVTVPMGNQYGTDSGESSGEGDGDHTNFGLVRDHFEPALFWRDATNPSFRRLRLSDVDLSVGAPQRSVIMETGPFFVDMASQMQ